MIIPKYLDLLSFARDRAKDQANVKNLISIALGIALSRKIQLPSNEVEDGYTHYAEQVCEMVMAEAARFNENLVVDLDVVESVARAFWLMRYFNAYPMKVIPISSADEGHFMNKLTGIGHLVNPEVFTMCQDESSTIISLVNKIRDIESQPA